MTFNPHGAVDAPPEPPVTPCPFVIGDHIRSTYDHGETARVIELTAAGFRYRLDHPGRMGTMAGGGTILGGECYPQGYATWEKVPPADEPVAAEKPLTFTTTAANRRIVGNSSPVMTITSAHLITIYAADGRELVHVKPDGTVVVSEEGAEPEAARRFWDALQVCGVGLLSRIRHLEEQLVARKQTKITLNVVRENGIPAFGAWHCPPPGAPVEDGTILLNTEACFGGLEDENGNEVHMDTEERKRLLIETLMHEFGHALEHHFGLPDNEAAMEAAISSWRPKVLNP